MARLADYFVVVGYDSEKGRSGVCSGKICQRFPEKDWEDTPFIDGIELFCQPQGWTLSTVRQESKFIVSVLTDIDANRHYCACLSFNESVAMTPTKQPDDEDGDGAENSFVVAHHSIMYAPKCLVLVSRLDYFETFRNCLGIIYTVYMEGLPVPMETLVGNILGCVQVPPPGGPQVRFSIGASDRQALQPPLSNTLPVTRTAVATLFQQLGIHNSLCLFCAALTEHKILIHSRSYSRLTDACHALVALLHPFKYSHVYIPLLPSLLVEFLSTPTPFIMGIHSSLRTEISDLLDVIVVDLDGGSISIPECVTVPCLPEPLNSLVHDALTMVLHPDVLQADNTFPSAQAGPSAPAFLDKEIRAIFLRLFAHILQGYRLSLTIIRIHPKPFITFHKAAFLGQRNLIDDEFTTKVLDCMFFNAFVSERGPPYRQCDTFDELYAGMQDVMKAESSNYELMFKNIQELAQQLYQNENPNPQPYVQKIPRPTEGAFTRIHQPTFPTIDAKKVNEIIEEGLSKHNIKPRLQVLRPQLPRIIPVGSAACNALDGRVGMTNSARRLEVLRNCVNCIFENKISDAKKALPAVLRALKTKPARLALCSELSQHVIGNKAILEHQQFDLVVRLMNCALQDDSYVDAHGVAAALLPLATAFCRKLCTGVIQFAYTCIQDHAVWSNQQFWEASFYQDVQKDIKALYLTGHENHRGALRESSLSPTNHRDGNELSAMWAKDRCLNVPNYPTRRVSGIMRPPEPTALEIAAEQMRTWASLSSEKQSELVSNEESTVYSQAIHYANRIVYLRVPLDVSKGNYSSPSIEGESNSNSIITNSVADSDSLGAESGFEEDTSEIGANVIRFVSRFVDKVCTESGVTEDHVKSLHQMIPGVVAMHIETLEAVHRESKRLPPIQKPKIIEPVILIGERLVPLKLRVYLIPDGREEGTGGNLGGPALLPAEGAIFLTNYRVIFKGSSCDPFSCEQVIMRSFPIASLTKEKRVSVQYLAHLDQWLQEGLQLRSSTFQLIKVAFDEEVTSEDIEAFRKYIQHLRNPSSVYDLFAFAGQASSTAVTVQKQKEKNATLRGLAKKTLLKTARKAGFKQKPSSRKQKYILSNLHPSGKSLTIPGRMQGNFPLTEETSNDRPMSLLEDDAMLDDDEVPRPLSAAVPQTLQTDSKTLEKLSNRSYYRDFIRLGLGSLSNSGSASGAATKGRADPFRMSTINAGYTLCRSYPGLLVVPCSVSDDSFRRLSRCHRHGRIPVLTWRHPRTKALLLRGSSFYNKGVMGMLKGHQSSTSNSNESSPSLEQEKLFAALVNCTPPGSHAHSAWTSMTDSSLSINSLTLAAGLPSASGDGLATLTPEVGRRGNPFSKAMNSLRHSGGRVAKPGFPAFADFSRWGSLKEKGSLTAIGPELGFANNIRPLEGDSTLDSSVHSFHKAALYVFGDKAQIKWIRPEMFSKCDFIPVDYFEVRQVKASFKKLMRACVASAVVADPERSFHRAVENSEWLQQLQNILRLAGAIVDLMDVQGSSVMVCLEDGWDITAQLVSVAQVCLDPYYRTLDGFRMLIEKEWLGFGHRFTHRGNQTAATQPSGFAPIFLQFLDVVHQIHRQFPLSFEFNQYYLKFLAYHHMSCRFRTFLLDCEFERVEMGGFGDEWGSSRHRGLDSGSDEEAGFNVKPAGTVNTGQSIWDYIDKYDHKSPVFYNFLYSSDPDNPVLRPYANISNLKIWDYYLNEDLAHGPAYDLDLMAANVAHEEEAEDASPHFGRSRHRVVVNGCYDDVHRVMRDSFTMLLELAHHAETEVGHLPQKWKILWDKLELPDSDSLTRQVSINTQMVRSHGRSVHKRSTLEILVRGKMAGEATQVYSHPHRFEKYTYTTPTYCDYCFAILWGLVKTGMRCVDCGYNCHEKCVESVPKNCTRYKSVSDLGTTAATLAKTGSPETTSVSSSISTIQSSTQYYDQFSSNVAENRTHEGYLYKRGALLKGWKQRWFVLDSIKHQLRYYDAMEDSHCKGFIDLAEVVSVIPAPSTLQGAPKKADDKAFFDLKTTRRIYNFLASDAHAAQEWIEKVQSCLQ